MRNVAIELVLMSELCILILMAVSFDAMSTASPLTTVCLSESNFCGDGSDADEDVVDGDVLIPWLIDIDRFCGDIKLPGDVGNGGIEVADGGGPTI